jgi:hypothetical protein
MKQVAFDQWITDSGNAIYLHSAENTVSADTTNGKYRQTDPVCIVLPQYSVTRDIRSNTLVWSFRVVI